ncbi:helix-turn-helix domain-containing protein [Streptomyces sp. NPDC005811]|uniref:winged helix-turn-helix transcriptional regulator n=1 Tax=Streptomyces sp. NPDC005811 TaxID=3154565 RepID=UPI0033FA7714
MTETARRAANLYGQGTPTQEAFERLANRWTMRLTHVLEAGPTRFNDLKKQLGVSSEMLSRVLRDLERDGLVARQVFAEVPVRVEYALTPLGGTMCRPVHAVREWAEQTADDIVAARAAYDRRSQAAEPSS